MANVQDDIVSSSDQQNFAQSSISIQSNSHEVNGASLDKSNNSLDLGRIKLHGNASVINKEKAFCLTNVVNSLLMTEMKM